MSYSDPFEAERLDVYTLGDPAGMLAVEYRQFTAVARSFSERDARRHPVPGARSLLEILAELAVENLPNGPAPSLSDSLHALDRVYAGWQVESESFQRVRARQLAYHLGELAMLRTLLDLEG